MNLRRTLLTLGLIGYAAIPVFAQRQSDLGIRFMSADYNRFQVEFRKPLGTNYMLRLGVSMGFQYEYPKRDIFSANDSVVTTRQSDVYGNHYDFRFGLERKLSYDWLSLHGDLIFSYSSMSQRNWSTYHVLDSAGTDWVYYNTNPYNGLGQDSAMAVTTVLGGGFALGISFNFPVTENFILNFTGNYTGIVRTPVSQRENNDIYNEFSLTDATVFELYPSAGIGLRYVFLGKREDTAPLPEN